MIRCLTRARNLLVVQRQARGVIHEELEFDLLGRRDVDHTRFQVPVKIDRFVGLKQRWAFGCPKREDVVGCQYGQSVAILIVDGNDCRLGQGQDGGGGANSTALHRRLIVARLDSHQRKEHLALARRCRAGPAHCPAATPAGGFHRVAAYDLCPVVGASIAEFLRGGEGESAVGYSFGPTLGFPFQRDVDVAAVFAKRQLVDHQCVAADALDQRPPPVGERGVGDLGHRHRRGTDHVRAAQGGVHGDLGFHQAVDPGNHLIYVTLQERIAGQTEFEHREGMIWISRSAVEAVDQYVITTGVGPVAEAGKTKGLFQRQPVAARFPFRFRQPVDAPLAGQIVGRRRLEPFLGPKRLADAKQPRVDARSPAILKPAAVAGNVGCLMQITH